MDQALKTKRIEFLRQRINDEFYLNAAIHRLALVLSNELMHFKMEGRHHERKRKKRKES